MRVSGADGGHLDVRMDHAPDPLPARHVPLTTASIAFSNRSAKRAFGLRSTRAVHVPEYSPAVPAMAARHAPVHRVGDFAADHAPPASVLPCASRSVHVPVTVPWIVSSSAVHVPARGAPLLVVALHAPVRLFCVCAAESWRAAACARETLAAIRNSRRKRNDNFRDTITSVSDADAQRDKTRKLA